MKKILTVFVLCLTVFVPVFADACIRKNGAIVCYDSMPDINDSARLLVEAYKEREKTEDLLKSLQKEGIMTADEAKIIREIAFSDSYGFSIEGYSNRENFENNIIFLRILNDKLSYALNCFHNTSEKKINLLELEELFDHNPLRPVLDKLDREYQSRQAELSELLDNTLVSFY